MYVAVKGGEKAIARRPIRCRRDQRRGDRSVAELGCDQVAQQLGLAVDRVMTEGGIADPRAGGAGHQTGQRRYGGSDLPAARLPHHAAAPGGQRAAGHRGDAPGAPHLGGLQRHARRPAAGPNLRLHPPPAGFYPAGQRRNAALPRVTIRRCRSVARMCSACSTRDRAGEAREEDDGAQPDDITRKPPVYPCVSRSPACSSWCAATKAFCWRWATPPSAATAATTRSPARSAAATSQRVDRAPKSWVLR